MLKKTKVTLNLAYQKVLNHKALLLPIEATRFYLLVLTCQPRRRNQNNNSGSTGTGCREGTKLEDPGL